MSKESTNIFDYFEEELDMFFQLHDNKINLLADAVNKYGANLSGNKIEEITGYSAEEAEASKLRSTIANLIHNYSKHKENYDDDFKSSKIDKSYLARFQKFVEKLNQNGIDGMCIRFDIVRTIDEFNVDSMSTEIILKQILNDDEKLTGYLPMVHGTFTMREEPDNKKTVKKWEMELDELTSFINALQKARDELISSAKKYKNKLGDEVILTADE